MGESLLFGDIFKYKEKEYIFLAKTEEILYAAEILDTNNSKILNTFYEKKLYDGKMYDPKKSGNLLYCYVVLQTVDFKDRLAHFKDTGRNAFDALIDKLPVSLNTQDLKQIKFEIETSNGISLELKKLIKNTK